MPSLWDIHTYIYAVVHYARRLLVRARGALQLSAFSASTIAYEGCSQSSRTTRTSRRIHHGPPELEP